jgi:arabinofuranosyltransferase
MAFIAGESDSVEAFVKLGVPVVLVAALGVFVSQCLWLGNFRVDDAYITFSFSKNLAAGHGPVYSHGVRVEGYSDFLWMALVAVPLLFTRGAAPLAGARVMAAPFVLLLGWATYRMVRATTGSRTLAAVTVLLLAFHTDLAVAYLSGLETVPYTALVTAAFAVSLESWSEPRLGRAVPWLAVAVALMRIDGLGVAALLFVCDAGRKLARRRMGGERLRELGRWLPALAVYVLWFAWRWRYYGLPLPVPYYAKALIPILLPARGREYVLGEITGSLSVLGLFAGVGLLGARRWAALPLVACAVAHLAYVAGVGGDWMPFGRFILPVTPVLTALLVAGCGEIALAAGSFGATARGLAVAMSFAVLCAAAGRADHRFWNTPEEDGKVAEVRGTIAHVDGLRRAAPFLQRVVPPGARLVTDYGGVFAYYTDAAVIEVWGLANATIARRGGTERVNPIFGRTCPECYPELDPEYFHVLMPIVRPVSALGSAADVIREVWQTDTIGRYIDFPRAFAAGRIVDLRTREAVYFLEKRRPGTPPRARVLDERFAVEYPFE